MPTRIAHALVHTNAGILRGHDQMAVARDKKTEQEHQKCITFYSERVSVRSPVETTRGLTALIEKSKQQAASSIKP